MVNRNFLTLNSFDPRLSIVDYRLHTRFQISRSTFLHKFDDGTNRLNAIKRDFQPLVHSSIVTTKE